MLEKQRFQSFEDRSDATQTAARVAALHQELAARGLDGFLVPRADEFQGEYVPPSAQRLAWISGFTGSWGLAAVFRDRAVVFVDGRYVLQVREQVDLNVFTPVHAHETPPPEWLEANLKKGEKLGYDPWLHTESGIEQLRAAATKAGAELVACAGNPLDAVWEGRPPAPQAKVAVYDEAHAGETSASKRARIAEDMRKSHLDAAVIPLPESICWLFNVRGGDVPHTPFALSYAILHGNGEAEWFIDETKLTHEVRRHIGNAVTVRAIADLGPALDRLGAAKARVGLDPAHAAAWMFARAKAAGADIVRAPDPCLLPKACKNNVELQGIREAHVRDGAALSRFLCWLAKEGPTGDLTEIDTVKRLEDFRHETGALKDVSFESISGAGPNGAIIHYRVSEKTNRPVRSGELFLIDSGAQYEDGTTDVTRTIAIGTPSAEQRRNFTLVLKGHIALAMARFPEGTTGVQLDTLARMALWNAGLDYDHGTGHGVGHYLSVHEGPQNISKRPVATPLRAGMVCSNEPGYYKAGEYGIRIENLIAVKPPEEIPGGERKMLSFETLTLAPIDLALVEPGLLSPEERDWLNAYHARVRAALDPRIDAATRPWLTEATRAI